jgi:imidazolonepropionase-like amidohydrolase
MKALMHAIVLDGTKDFVPSKKTILIDSKKIVKIQDDSLPIPDGCEIEDLTGKYVMPGLINLHAHLFGSGKPSKMLGGGGAQKKVIAFVNSPIGHPVADLLVKNHVKQMLFSGVTTVRTMGDFCYSDVRVRNLIRKGKAIGPRLLVCGPAITCVGGHGDGTFAKASNDLDELTQFVKNNIDQEVDLIKICVTGGVMDAKKRGEPGMVKMTLEQTKLICDIAHQCGLKVASHTESEKGIEVALEGGVDTIEHGSTLTEKTIEMFKKQNASFIITLSPALPLAKLPSEVTCLNELAQYNTEVLLKNMIEGGKKAIEENISVGLGTDCSCPLVPPYDTWRELDYFTKMYDETPTKAIHMATLGNAKIAGVDNITGSIEENKFADLIVLSKNPLDNIKNLQNLDEVYFEGKCYRHLKIKKNQEIEQQLDKLC